MGKIGLRAKSLGLFIPDSDRSAKSVAEAIAAQMVRMPTAKRVHRWLSSENNLRINNEKVPGPGLMACRALLRVPCMGLTRRLALERLRG